MFERFRRFAPKVSVFVLLFFGEAFAEAEKPLLPAIRLPVATDADVQRAFVHWQMAHTASDKEGTKKALDALLQLKAEIGAESLEPMAVAVLRAAMDRMKASDELQARLFAEGAVELAPQLPAFHFMHAQILFQTSPFEPAAYSKAILQAAVASVSNGPSLLSLLRHLGLAVLIAWVLATLIFVAAMVFRYSMNVVHQVWHWLPRSSTKVHAVVLILWLLSLPFLLGYGVLPSLLLLFFLWVPLLSGKERWLLALLFSGAGFLPECVEVVFEKTSFWGTRAEMLHRIETGGMGLETDVEALHKKLNGPSPAFDESLVSARYKLRRGEARTASDILKIALNMNPAHAVGLVNLGNAMFALEDYEGALASYQAAIQSHPRLPEAYFNLYRLHKHKASLKSFDGEAMNDIQARQALEKLEGLRSDWAREAQTPAPKGLNVALKSPRLSFREILDARRTFEHLRLPSQGAWWVLGNVPRGLARIYPPVLVSFALLVGWLIRRRGVSSECRRCGQVACRRCLPALNANSNLCGECVTAFAPRAVVSAAFRTRKEIEVSQHQRRQAIVARFWGFLWAGAGHFFADRTLGGFVWAALVAMLLGSLWVQEAVIPPVGLGIPEWALFWPTVGFVCLSYVSSLFRLRRYLSR